MFRHKFIWILFFRFFIVLSVFFILITFFLTAAFRNLNEKLTSEELQTKATLIADEILETVFPYSRDLNSKTDLLLQELGAKGNIRITLLLPTGEAIGDSEQNSPNIDNFITPLEIETALKGKVIGNFNRQENPYLLFPLGREKKVTGILKITKLTDTAAPALTPLYVQIFFGFLEALLLALLLCTRIAKKISAPLAELKQGVLRFGQGQFNPPLAIPEVSELAPLAQSLNQMAFSLNNYRESLQRRQSQDEVILASRTEGVIVIDTAKRILNINSTATHFLQITAEKVKGRRIEEFVFIHNLLEFINKVVLTCTFQEAEIIIYEKKECYIHVQGIPLKDTTGRTFGYMFVIQDITQLRRLENVRKEFASNVSHELKTPLTSIKGFVDTLLNGAISQPEQAKRFLVIIARQTDRIIAIVEDLMSLARLERYEEQGGIVLEQVLMLPVLRSALKACEERALEKNIRLQLRCEANLRHNVNAHLIEQAVINLVDNAIKYSEKSREILVVCQKQEQETSISVKDYGVGIAAEHLPRLFERFYRVDKARSSSLGGTGLGLSIVKHIAQAHGGQVTVESRPGKGSVFTIHLPLTLNGEKS